MVMLQWTRYEGACEIRHYLWQQIKKKFFHDFPVTPSHRLSVSWLRVTGAFPSRHTPVTHTLPCDGNVTGKQPSCHA